ncbi:hypothetical protein CRM22_008712 [Opisthorchis felineus]|uniref:Uncharacterized protein n=1 Tax=Opisthorchis felineus TaxID=147828 RepID=A0A4S2LA20_OPIFE|nr:hypothetical protein CRM22_008712 [Opisthorchis felineus]
MEIRPEPCKKPRRSISLPEPCLLGGEESSPGSIARRKAKSLTRVGDRSNSAAPIRRQPHPFALQALGFRANFGRPNRLPEWPPPDPPPLTPLNPGGERNLTVGNTTQRWPPRPWWRRTVPTRPIGPVVHVTIDTAETIPVRAVDRPAQAWTSTSEEQEVGPQDDNHAPTPLLASWSEVESEADGDTNAVVIATTSGPVESADTTLHHANWTVLQIYQNLPGTNSEENTVQTRDPGYEQPETLSIGVIPTEDFAIYSPNSEEVQEESTFQIFFVVLDSNPTVHTQPGANDEDIVMSPAMMSQIMQHLQSNYGDDLSETHSDRETSNEL